jgi:LacI family transcriptional regulator
LGAWDELAEFVGQETKPTVGLSFRRPHLQFPRTLEDHDNATQLVAEHFLAHGPANFADYSNTINWSYDERGFGFVGALRRAVQSYSWLKSHESPAFQTDRDHWRRLRAWLAIQLRRLPKPLAVFADKDQQALDMLESYEIEGLLVPDEVAIVRAEKYVLAPDAVLTPISSVDTNLGLLRYRGTKLVDELMHDRRPLKTLVHVSAACVTVHKSSTLLAVAHRGVPGLVCASSGNTITNQSASRTSLML